MFNELKKKFVFTKSKKITVLVLTAVLVVVILAIYFLNSVAPIIVTLSEARIRSLTTLAINNAVFEVMTDSVKYSDLITVEKNTQGDIILIQANTLTINKLARDTARVSEINLSKIGEQGISIPIGTLTGTPIFAGYGPIINIIVLPVGSVNCHFVSEFEEAGINQTRHKIYLDVITAVTIILPTANASVKTTTQVLVSESIIVGKVPDTFINIGTLGGNTLDLLP